MHNDDMATRRAGRSNRAARSPQWLSWAGLVYYGETVGFVFAWIAGVTALVYSASNTTPEQPPVDQMAVAGVSAVER